MKKIIVVLALALVAFTAKAQFYVGGTLHFETNETTNANGDPSVGVVIAPEFGYSINEKFAVGGVLGLSNLLGGGANLIQIAPYVRYSALNLGPATLFLDGQLSILLASGGGATQSTFGIGVAPGIAIPVGDKISFVGHFGQIGYYGQELTVEVSPANINMGLYYNF